MFSVATVKPLLSLVSWVWGASRGAATASGISTPGRASVRGTSTRLLLPKRLASRPLLRAAATAGAAWTAAVVEMALTAALGSCSRAEASMAAHRKPMEHPAGKHPSQKPLMRSTTGMSSKRKRVRSDVAPWAMATLAWRAIETWL